MAANLRGILLAAGYSKRFGSNKLLQALPAGSAQAGTPIALASARHFLDALPDSVAVVRPRAQKLARILRDAGCNTVLCKNAGEGMGTSLAAGVRATSDADGWIVALADMPFIRPETIRIVAKALRDGAAIAAPSFRGERTMTGSAVRCRGTLPDDVACLSIRDRRSARSIGRSRAVPRPVRVRSVGASLDAAPVRTGRSCSAPA